MITALLTEAGHRLAEHAVVKDDIAAIIRAEHCRTKQRQITL